MRASLVAGTLILALGLLADARGLAQPPGSVREWPAVRPETRPWIRWWWHGSAVDRASLTAQLETLQKAGLGGVEITPIYGVRGEERRFIQYLSSEWVRMLEHTLTEARRLGVGVDMATGTGWPFGGPWVGDDIAPRSLAHKVWTVAGAERLTEPVRFQQAPLVRAVGTQVHIVSEGAPGDPPRGENRDLTPPPGLRRPIQISDLLYPLTANRDLQALALEQVKYARDLPLVALVAYGDRGDVLDLTSRVDSRRMLQWTAPDGAWTLYGVFAGWHGKLVERAAPGGEGNVIDHFSREAVTRYLQAFDRAFASARLAGLRGFFNDSYEVDDAAGQADWTPALLDEFQKRRGYDLRRHLPALLGRDSAERNHRVLADYRQTISDLLLETFTTEWTRWARSRNAMARNQAHGSPGNLLDLYAASDIPETEGSELPRFKWASSAANVAGRRLVAAEAGTWLGEHFRTTLAEVRAALDRFFVGGVNHIVYHGTAYSPPGEPWPGWLFYASVEFCPQNAWWDDFGALNQYVTRVQSLLQSGRADHDVLLYFPFYDAITPKGKGLLTHFGGGNPPKQGSAFEEAADEMQRRGYTYDFISDRQLREVRVERGRLVTSGGASYRVVVLPEAGFIPPATFEQVLALARRGAIVISFRGWPTDVAGLEDVEEKRAALREAIAAVRLGSPDAGEIGEARLGEGRLLQGRDLSRLLDRAGVGRERMVDLGLQFARRSDAAGRIYFISNPGRQVFDGWVPLDTNDAGVTVFEPVHGARGEARARRSPAGGMEVHLQIPPEGSLLVATARRPHPQRYRIYEPAGAPPIEIAGSWAVRFVKGGPVLPPARTIERLESWTGFGGPDEPRFSGTATYTTSFARPEQTAAAWELDLGTVHESARVRLNGQDLATLMGPAFRVVVDGARLSAANALEISVTNLSANRIADLDRHDPGWKKFYNVNFPARFAENRGPDGLFTAAGWKPLPSGLLGPVRLTPLRVIER